MAIFGASQLCNDPDFNLPIGIAESSFKVCELVELLEKVKAKYY